MRMLSFIILCALVSNCRNSNLKDCSTAGNAKFLSNNLISPDGKKIPLEILNNPFNLSEEDSIYFWINDQLTFKGTYQNHYQLSFFNSTLDSHVRADVCIKTNNKFYYLLSKRAFWISNTSQRLYLIFAPSNGKSESFFILSQEKNIL